MTLGVARVKGDLANLRRDPMLVAAMAAPLLVGALVRIGVPRTTGIIEVTEHLPLVLGFSMLLAPTLAGFVMGFLLLEEREDRILDAIAVTPLGTGGFFAYRLWWPVLTGGLGAMVVALLAGISTVGVGRLVAAVVLAAATGGLVTLVLAVLASDRVQGLALGKLTGVTLVAAVGFQLLPGPWRWLLAAIPQVWVVDAVAGPGPVLFPVAIGAVLHIGLGWILWRLLLRSR